jgi:hypothetical protein
MKRKKLKKYIKKRWRGIRFNSISNGVLLGQKDINFDDGRESILKDIDEKFNLGAIKSESRKS